MNPFKKHLWMTPSRPEEAINSGMIDYVTPSATGLLRVVAKPIALSERRPADIEKNEYDQCYYGRWHDGSWEWKLVNIPLPCVTHFLPAGVEVLPATCFAPDES